jgi:hypothetical protein
MLRDYPPTPTTGLTTTTDTITSSSTEIKMATLSSDGNSTPPAKSLKGMFNTILN